MRPGQVFAVAALTAAAALAWWRLSSPEPAERVIAPGLPVLPEVPLPAGTAAEPGVDSSEQREVAATVGADEEPVVIDDEATMQALFLSLAGQIEAPLREWAESRGLPREDPNGNYMLEQPYQQYDDATLQALARNGDMWAQQIMADRLARLRPAEAMEYYRQAAAAGSIYAMTRLADLSARIAGMSPDFTFADEGVALDQYYSLRDGPIAPDMLAYAWDTVAEMAGMPPFLSMMGGRRTAAEVSAAGCELAGNIYTDLLEQRAAAGAGAYPSDPPPLWVDADALRGHASSACEHPEAVSYDLSACEPYVVRNPQSGEEVNFYVCDKS